MTKLKVLAAGLAMILPSLLSVRSAPAALSSRVIVSNTLNDTLTIIDAASLQETQPPLLSKGLAPVRMDVHAIDGKPYLFTADHGIEGGLGIFDLSGDTVLELPASPFPARPGSVGVSVGTRSTPSGQHIPMAWVTNTWQALGGCGMPSGSVTAYDLSNLSLAGVAVEAQTLDVSGSIPYGVAVDSVGYAYVSTNCGNALRQYDTQASAQPVGPPSVSLLHSWPTGAGPDGVVADVEMIFVANISGDSVSVIQPAFPDVPPMTVAVPSGGPIDMARADTRAGHHYLLTSNGEDDTVGLIDRDIARGCMVAHATTCPQAFVTRFPTGVKGGAPEGVSFDPVSNRIFAVNKTIGAPSLTVIQLDDSGDTPTAGVVATLPLGALGSSAPIPALIAFDVVVQTR